MPSPARLVENVWNYPRPPALQPTTRLLEVKWVDKHGHETLIARTTAGFRVLETSHPPTYYLPPDSVAPELKLETESKHTFCEWKGSASYHTLSLPSLSPTPAPVKSRVWSYSSPTPAFTPIKDYLSFYASAGGQRAEGWRCFVDGEQVEAQPGDFYGGWKTSDIDGGKKGVKGGPGTWGW